jgi:hypothetical protein
MRFRRALIGLLAAATVLPALPALADGRNFPAGARRGTMTPAVFPEIIINGDTRRMAPGGRILSQNNLIVMPASVTGSKLRVNYLENPDGSIQKIWILTAVEAEQPPPKPAAIG